MILEMILTYYCKEEGISYKQGLNEVLAPFYLLTRQGLSLTEVYIYFKNFVKGYLKTMFVDKEFRPLQAQFLIFRLLLKYHDPRFSFFLSSHKIGPELFATPWFITLFASKINNMKVLYSLWEAIMEENDPIFVCLVGIAFLQYHINEIFNLDNSMIPQVISQLHMDDSEELKSILVKAREMKANMPYSIYIRLNSLNFYDLDSVDDIIDTLEKQCCLSIHPREIIQRTFPEFKFCKCSAGACLWCAKTENQVPLLVIDCRPEEDRKGGLIPNSELIDGDSYRNKDVLMEVPDKYIERRTSFHICLMGRTSFNHTEFDLENEPEENDVYDVQGLIEHLLKDFLAKGFPYISLVQGGYEECHDLALRLGCELDDHDKNYCLPCNPGGLAVSSFVKKSFSSIQKKIFGGAKKVGKYAKKMISGEKEKDEEKEKPKEAEAELSEPLNDQSLVPEEPVTKGSAPPEEKNVPTETQIINKMQLKSLKEDPSVSFYICRRYDRQIGCCFPEEYYLIISTSEIMLVAPFENSIKKTNLDPVTYIIERAMVKDLLKITSKKNSQKTLTFYFRDTEEFSYCYTLRDDIDAKKCIHQVSHYYHLQRGATSTV